MTETSSIQIKVEGDPSPLVKIFARKLSVASHMPEFQASIQKMNGCFAVKSMFDPQSLSIFIKGDVITLNSGIDKAALITVETDLNDDSTGKTKVHGLWWHPLFTMRVARLLNFKPDKWHSAAKRFWETNQDYTGMPKGMLITCTDDNRGLLLGESDDMTLIGKAKHLSALFSGDDIFIQAAMAGKLRGQISFEQAVVLSDVGLQMLLGDR